MFKWKFVFFTLVMICIVSLVLHVPVVVFIALYHAPVNWHFLKPEGNIFSGQSTLLFSPKKSRLLYHHEHTPPSFIVFDHVKWRLRYDLLSFKEQIWGAWELNSPDFEKPVILKYGATGWDIDQFSGYWHLDRLLHLGGMAATLFLKGDVLFSFHNIHLSPIRLSGTLSVKDLQTGLIPHYVLGSYTVALTAEKDSTQFNLSSQPSSVLSLEGKGLSSFQDIQFKGSITPLNHITILKPVLQTLTGQSMENGHFPIAIHVPW